MKNLFGIFNLLLVTLLLFAGCTSEDDSGGGGGTSNYTVSVQVQNAASGDQFVVAFGEPTNGAYSAAQTFVIDDITQSYSKSFTAGTYKVTLLESPAQKSCTVNSPVSITFNSTITISCGGDFYLQAEGAVVGLGSTDNVTLSDGNLTRTVCSTPLASPACHSLSPNFSFDILSQTTYNITVTQQPAGKTCTVNQGSGIMTEAVSGIQVICSKDTYTVSGTVSGLSTNASIRIANNGGAGQLITDNGSDNYSFSFPVPEGATYALSIMQQPRNKCVIDPDRKAVSVAPTANVTGIEVKCWQLIDDVGDNNEESGLNVMTNAGAESPQLTSDNSSLFVSWKQAKLNGKAFIAARKYDSDAQKWSWVDDTYNGIGGNGSGKVSLWIDNVTSPAALVRNDQSLWVAWSQPYNGAYQLWLSKYVQSEAVWDPISTGMFQVTGCSLCGINDNTSENATSPSLIDNGTLYASWEEGGSVVWSSFDDNNTTWTVQGSISGVSRPRLLEENGQVLLMYDNQSTTHRIHLSDNSSAGSSIPATSVSADNSTHYVGISSLKKLVLSDDLKTKDNGVVDNESVMKDSTQWASSPNLVNVEGTYYLAWLERSGTDQIRVAKLVVGNSTTQEWKRIDGDGKDGLNIRTSQVTSDLHAIAHQGKLYLTWVEVNSSGKEQIRVAESPF